MYVNMFFRTSSWTNSRRRKRFSVWFDARRLKRPWEDGRTSSVRRRKQLKRINRTIDILVSENKRQTWIIICIGMELTEDVILSLDVQGVDVRDARTVIYHSTILLSIRKQEEIIVCVCLSSRSLFDVVSSNWIICRDKDGRKKELTCVLKLVPMNERARKESSTCVHKWDVDILLFIKHALSCSMTSLVSLFHSHQMTFAARKNNRINCLDKCTRNMMLFVHQSFA